MSKKHIHLARRRMSHVIDELYAGRKPYRGDLHMHTCRSDGTESPAVVAANYRALGYDFLAITDHHRYYPSLEAMEAFSGLKTGYTLLPGEEVHLPGNPVHIVNFAGRYSVNGLLTCKEQYKECGDDPARRSFGMTPPAVMDEAEYRRQVEALAATLDLPEQIKPHAFC